jgi:hypothetical protein
VLGGEPQVLQSVAGLAALVGEGRAVAGLGGLGGALGEHLLGLLQGPEGAVDGGGAVGDVTLQEALAQGQLGEPPVEGGAVPVEHAEGVGEGLDGPLVVLAAIALEAQAQRGPEVELDRGPLLLVAGGGEDAERGPEGAERSLKVLLARPSAAFPVDQAQEPVGAPQQLGVGARVDERQRGLDELHRLLLVLLPIALGPVGEGRRQGQHQPGSVHRHQRGAQREAGPLQQPQRGLRLLGLRLQPEPLAIGQHHRHAAGGSLLLRRALPIETLQPGEEVALDQIPVGPGLVQQAIDELELAAAHHGEQAVSQRAGLGAVGRGGHRRAPDAPGRRGHPDARRPCWHPHRGLREGGGRHR